MKQIVVPGEVVSEERKRLGSNVYVANGKIRSKVLGITDTEKVVMNMICEKEGISWTDLIKRGLRRVGYKSNAHKKKF